jgi:hypothetical protein
MSTEETGYLPGDPRYGLSGETLRRYYRGDAASEVIDVDRLGSEGLANSAHRVVCRRSKLVTRRSKRSISLLQFSDSDATTRSNQYEDRSDECAGDHISQIMAAGSGDRE